MDIIQVLIAYKLQTGINTTRGVNSLYKQTGAMY